MASYEWKTLINSDLGATNTNCLNRVETNDHPLKSILVTERIPRRILGSLPSTGRTTPTVSAMLEPLSKALEGLDPLTAFSMQEMDPLSKMAAEADVVDNINIVDSKRTDINWNSRKAAILSKFTTSEKISIITSFLSEGEKIIVKAQSTAVDKVQHRLEQLDDFEEGSQRKLDLSQSEYVKRIEQLNKELVAAWNSEQRVKALKIAIQCAKLLADTDVLKFYPSKFVLVTDILDIFGQLVYDRLRTKADYFREFRPGSKTPTALPEDFKPHMVPDTAKETCLNWFFKIASIRELVPRIYVEIALLRCYNFLSLNDCPDALKRLTKIINGIGNPLVAVYARCYLCRIGLTLNIPSMNEQYLIDNFNGFLDSYHHLFSRSVKSALNKQKVPLSVYMTLFTPALDFILEAVTRTASDKLLDDLLERCKTQGNSSLILNTIMSAFKPSSVALRSLQFFDMMGLCLDQGLPLYILLRTLGLCISVSPPPLEHRRQVLNIAWKHITSLNSIEEYITCAEAWMVFVVQCFSFKEINIMLGDLIQHLSPDRSYEQYYNQLKFILEKIISYTQDLESLLVMDNFLLFIDLFQQETIKVEVCKIILSSFHSEQKINDAVVINSLMSLCSVLHDSVNALTPDDECRQIGDILCKVVEVVDYGRNFEQQLNFYVEARGMFSNIDAVLAHLVHCVNSLAVTTRQIVKGNHTKKTADFVRACAAYCFITIPSINSIKTRLELYLLSGQVALFNQCLGQAEACFKTALSIINELKSQKNSESFLLNYIKQFLSLLLVIPDNPDCSVLNLTRSLLNIVQGFEWETPALLVIIYLNVIDLLSSAAQQTYPYHVDKVESNDSLYGSDPKFILEINKMCSLILGEILNQLKIIGSNSKQQSYLAIELFCRVAIRGDLNNSQLKSLALNLWNLGTKRGMVDNKYLKRTRDYMKWKSYNANNLPLQDLVDNLNIPS